MFYFHNTSYHQYYDSDNLPVVYVLPLGLIRRKGERSRSEARERTQRRSASFHGRARPFIHDSSLNWGTLEIFKRRRRLFFFLKSYECVAAATYGHSFRRCFKLRPWKIHFPTFFLGPSSFFAGMFSSPSFYRRLTGLILYASSFFYFWRESFSLNILNTNGLCMKFLLTFIFELWVYPG